MPDLIPSETLNAFAQGLAEHFAVRATGLDEESTRLLFKRPSDHVLTGFLTPIANDPNGSQQTDEDQLASDLPRDAATEQTNLGMHWLVPRIAFQSEATIQVRVQLSVYVRRLPSREEQEQAQWSIPRETARDHTASGGPTPRRRAEVVPVWTREDLHGIEVRAIRLADLWQQRHISFSLENQVLMLVRNRDSHDLYPGRRQLVIFEEDVATEEAYANWRATISSGDWPIRWQPTLDVRLGSVPTEPGLMRITARVINRTSPVRSSLDYVDPNLYGVSIHLTVPENAHQSTIFRELPKSFRYDRLMPAVGINAHVTCRTENRHVVLGTQAVPIFTARRLEPRVIPGAAPRFEVLASDPLPTLQRILDAMRVYDENDWARAVAAQEQPGERREAEDARRRFQVETDRLARGVTLLADNRYPHVARAFSLMNRAMSEASGGRFSEWRLFQIVFVVSQLPVLASREYPELREEDHDDVDILWFAAGGGKTEAFLGLILWQAFFDRLRGKDFGVASFVRFPLRLLTFQQLQRLASALAAADQLRQREGLGGARFSIGYFVGRGTTPNMIDNDTHNRFTQHGPDSKLKRLYTCPFCNAPTTIAYNAAQRLVEHRCTRATSGCANGNVRLPVYVVDADLYRFLPTVVVSTVDKFAQFGQNQRFAQLTGRITVLCPEHGVSFLGANSSLCPTVTDLDRRQQPTHCGSHLLRYGPFHDLSPSLLIQDELHLLSEELGTFDAHYETAVAEMVRSLGGRPWKVIAATATIENYEDHAWHLYLRRARQFPGPGPQAYESFYYTQSRERIGRIFVGVLGVGRKHTPIVTRTLALIYLELQKARDLASRDISLACERYGLGSLDKTAFDALVFLYELVLTYVLTRKGSDQVAEAIESRVKRELQEVAPNHGELLVDTFNGGVSEAEMSSAVQRIREASSQGRPEDRTRGIVATNVIGHGVDVDRFNVMVFAGFPRLVAEYIQASARVGRTYPGLSFFVATPQSERDRSIFDRFFKFHEYVDRLVDPSAINRWPESAMRRTVPGLLSGYLMGVAAEHIGRRLVTVEQVQDAHGDGLSAVLMEEVVNWLEQAYGSDNAPSSERYRNQLRLKVQNLYSSIINRPRVRGERPNNLNTFLEAMQSLRDTDDPAKIFVNLPREIAVLRRLIRG